MTRKGKYLLEFKVKNYFTVYQSFFSVRYMELNPILCFFQSIFELTWEDSKCFISTVSAWLAINLNLKYSHFKAHKKPGIWLQCLKFHYRHAFLSSRYSPDKNFNFGYHKCHASTSKVPPTPIYYDNGMMKF